MVAAVLQLAGLAAVAVGAWMEFGVGGGVAGAGVACVYVGLAFDERGD